MSFHSTTLVNHAGKGVRSQNQVRFLCLKFVPQFLCDLSITHDANLISQNKILFQRAELFFPGLRFLYTTSNVFWKWVCRRLRIQTSSIASFSVHLLSFVFLGYLFFTLRCVHPKRISWPIRRLWEYARVGGRLSEERTGAQLACTEIHFGRNARRRLKVNVGGWQASRLGA